MNLTNVRSQKAKGIMALAMVDPPYGLKQHGFTLIQREEDLSYFYGNKFVRPCPTRPRHGFVESRFCATAEEIHKVWQEARKADPEAELLIGNMIKAAHSLILAGNRAVIGPNHDGATSGKGTVEIGICPLEPNMWLRKASGVVETPYWEIVVPAIGDKYGHPPMPTVVQLRDGPALPTAVDFVPARVTVKAIVEPCEDLLSWEAQVASLPAGTVVYSAGGSLGSHAGVHCVINGVPFLTSFRPEVGDTLEPIGDAAPPLDLSEFQIGVAAALKAPLTMMATRDYTSAALAVLHNWPEMRKFPTASRMLGYGCMAAARLGIIACDGEARHYSLKLNRQTSPKYGRTSRYEKAFSVGPKGLLSRAQRAVLCFQGSGWQGGYGGPAWGRCIVATLDLWNEIQASMQSGSVNETKIVAALNRIIHVSHNGGELLTKFVGSSYFEYAPAVQACHAAGHFLYAAGYTGPKQEYLPFAVNVPDAADFILEEDDSDDENEDCDCEECCLTHKHVPGDVLQWRPTSDGVKVQVGQPGKYTTFLLKVKVPAEDFPMKSKSLSAEGTHLYTPVPVLFPPVITIKWLSSLLTYIMQVK